MLSISGRRCTTGQGIYAFKCRRAEQLFNTLQQVIQVRNLNPDSSVLETLAMESTRPPGTLPRPPPTSHPDYLEPAPAPSHSSRFSGTIRLGSISSGPLSPEVHSPGSPSSTNILEVMPLAPLPAGGAQVTNLYQFQDFPQQREHNNNKKPKVELSGHSYSNTRDINSDLATLRHSLQQRQLDQGDDDDSVDMEELCPASALCETVPLSPSHSTASEHYATLAVEREPDDRLYMNLAPGENNALSAIREEAGAIHRNSYPNPQTPASAAPSTRNTNFSFMDRMELEEEKHNYANLGPTEVKYDARLLNRQRSKLSRGPSLEVPPVPEEHNPKVKYAILDLHSSKTDSEGEIAQSLPPSSPKKPTIGYTTIDFNKTVALKSVALGTEVDTEGSRKTRHNSTALPPNSSGT